jgi:hypothetical protein
MGLRHTTVRVAMALGLVLSTFLLAAPHRAFAAAPMPPFGECPTVDLDTSCGVLVVIGEHGKAAGYYDPAQGPYEGQDDALVGVLNGSSSPVSSIVLTGPGIFNFDGDGLCTYVDCSGWSALTGYEGPNTKFSVTAGDTGTVTFPAPLAPGASTYFSLESAAPFQPFVVAQPNNRDWSDVTPGQDIGGLEFGNVASGGTSPVQTLSISNGGSAALKISDVALTDPAAGFTVAGGSCVPAPGGTVTVAPGDPPCTIDVTFTGPTFDPLTSSTAGERAAEIKLFDNAPDSPHYLSLRGTATVKHLATLAAAGAEQGTSYDDPADPVACRTHTVAFGAGRIGWGRLEPIPQTLVGEVVEGHVATEDITRIPLVTGAHGFHYNADENFFVYPDETHAASLDAAAPTPYRDLLKPGNFKIGSESTPSEQGRVEVEWERATTPAGSTAPTLGLPAWAWPTVGDKVEVVGWHILDCGHGRPSFRSEIHPPLFVATYRNTALAPFAGASGRLGSYDPLNGVAATQVDVYASSFGGSAIGIETDHPGATWQPVNAYNGLYEFDVFAPSKPTPGAVLAPPQVEPMAHVGQSLLTWLPLPNGRGYHFSLSFGAAKAGTNLAYGAHIYVEWKKDPAVDAPKVSRYQVRTDWLQVAGSSAAKFASTDWALYVSVNEDQGGSLLHGTGLTGAALENSNHERYVVIKKGERIALADSRIVTVLDGQPLHVEYRVSQLNVSRYGCSSCGGGESGGTAARSYVSPPGHDTVRGSALLDVGKTLGADELNAGCHPWCFEVHYTITKLPSP